MVAFHSALGDLSLFIIFLESFHYKIFFVFHLLLLLLLSLLLLSFVLASNRICLRTWHVATRWRKKGSCRTFLRRQPAYLQLFDCLTQRLEKRKKTKPSRRKSPYGKLCMLIIIFRKTTTTIRRTTSITTPALLQLFFSLI